MQAEFGSVHVATVGASRRFESIVKRNVRWIRVKARAGNGGVVYVGGPATVSHEYGYELSAGNTLEIEFPYQDDGALTDFWLVAAASVLTMLNGTLTDSATSVTVDDASSIAVGDTIGVSDEQMRVTAKATNTLTVTRGVNGTTATAHHDDADVGAVYTADYAAMTREYPGSP